MSGFLSRYLMISETNGYYQPRKFRLMSRRRRKIAIRQRLEASMLKSLRPLVGRVNDAETRQEAVNIIFMEPTLDWVTLKFKVPSMNELDE